MSLIFFFLFLLYLPLFSSLLFCIHLSIFSPISPSFSPSLPTLYLLLFSPFPPSFPPPFVSLLHFYSIPHSLLAYLHFLLSPCFLFPVNLFVLSSLSLLSHFLLYLLSLPPFTPHSRLSFPFSFFSYQPFVVSAFILLILSSFPTNLIFSYSFTLYLLLHFLSNFLPSYFPFLFAFLFTSLLPPFPPSFYLSSLPFPFSLISSFFLPHPDTLSLLPFSPPFLLHLPPSSCSPSSHLGRGWWGERSVRYHQQTWRRKSRV